MNEVEKMYKNAGVKPTHYDACKIADAYWLNEELANEYGTFISSLIVSLKTGTPSPRKITSRPNSFIEAIIRHEADDNSREGT